MKKILLFTLCISAFSSFAKEGFFLQPTVGAGVGKVKYDDMYPTRDFKFALVHSEGLNIGYQFKHWTISSGLGYMRTGVSQKFDVLDALGNVVSTGKSSRYYNHISVPIIVGRKLAVGKKFSITPGLGTEITYNYSHKNVASYDGRKASSIVKGSEFKRYYNQVSAFSLVQVNFECAVNSKLSIVFGPKADYMVTNMAKSFTNISLHNYTVILNAGIKMNL